MRPEGLEGLSLLGWRPLLRLLLLLLLLSLLPRPVTRAQTTPGASSTPAVLGTPSAPTTPGALSDSAQPGTPSSPTAPRGPSAPSLQELARTLMQDFPLVDGCVGARWGNR